VYICSRVVPFIGAPASGSPRFTEIVAILRGGLGSASING